METRARTGSKKATASNISDQAIPKINEVTRPSGELERATTTPKVPQSSKKSDPSLLKAELLSKEEVRARERFVTDMAREEAVKASKSAEWMTMRNIPFGYTRQKKSSSNSEFLTASSVGTEHMETRYQWRFIPNILGTLTNRSIETVARSDINIITQGVLKIPDSWTTNPPPENLSRHEVRIRQTILEVMKDYNNESRNPSPPFFIPGMVQGSGWAILEGLEETDLSRTTDLGKNLATCSEWTILQVLMYPGMGSKDPVSELDVERHIGSLICGPFSMLGCQTLSNTKLVYPTILGCFGSYPKPDLATRQEEVPKSLYSPVILAADAKRRFKKSASSLSPNRVLAQLACAVQPTLQLLIILLEHCIEKGLITATPSNIQAILKPWMFIYGISYDYEGLSLHMLSVCLRLDDNNKSKRKWTFEACTTVSSCEQAFVLNRSGRPDALRLLFVAQRQAKLVMAGYSALKAEVQLPQEFIDLEKKWINDHL